MPDGQLCLFQREMRIPGGDIVTGVQCLARAEQWFLGHHTGHWPPDSADSESEAHFACPADVLIGESFFREDIEGQGRFYMVPDLRRAIDSDNDKLTDIDPLIMTMLTRENGLIQVYDARADVSKIFPWIKAESWDPSKIAKLDNETESAQAALRLLVVSSRRTETLPGRCRVSCRSRTHQQAMAMCGRSLSTAL